MVPTAIFGTALLVDDHVPKLQAFAEFLDSRAIDAEIGLQQRFRLHDAQGSSGVMRLAKRVIVATVGRHYLRRMSQICRLQVAVRS